METSYPYEQIDALVGRIFVIEDKTVGTAQQKFILRYRGKLCMEDSAAAYDQLAAQLEPLGLTPLFRWEENRQAIVLIPGLPKPRPSNPRINLILFIATLLTVWFSGALYGLEEPLPSDPVQVVLLFIRRGWPFAISMIAILGAHEFGHYLMGRHHGVHVTLPYFIPMPFSPFGTMGAFINMKEQPKNRRQLLDIGIAGPLAGMVVAVPVLLLGLSLSKVGPLPLAAQSDTMLTLEGNSVLYLFLKFFMFGHLLPAPATYGNLSPWLYWLRYFFTGQPFPMGGTDVMLHPVAMAGWVGLLVTTMNLIPAGQLDGGHILYVLLGRKNAKRLYPIILVALALLGLVWSGWWLWAFIIFLVGRFYAEPLDQITPLDNRRKWLAVLALVIFFLTFTPVPMVLI